MAPREELLRYLERVHRGAVVVPMVGDASTRRFFRMTADDGKSSVVMDYGAPFEDETDDVRLTRIFSAAALPVPKILEIAPSPGCLVLQDLGDETLEAALLGSTSPARRETLYRQAVELCMGIATRGTRALEASSRAAGPALDEERFRFEMAFFLEHYAGRPASDPPDSLAQRLFELADLAASGPRVFCHRDFHSRNLLVRGDGLAMVDIQDARWGPDTYDLASLLRDAYVEIDEGLVEAMLEVYARSLLGEGLRSRFEVVCVERMIKALGTFGYQVRTLGRRRYVSAIERTVRRLRTILPGLGALAALTGELDAAGLLEASSDL